MIPKIDLKTKKIIAAVKKRRVLLNYKKTCTQSQKLLIEQTWKEVATEMKSTVSACKAKWQSLKYCYRRYLKEEKSERALINGEKRKKWYLADDMEFMKPYINVAPSGFSRKNCENMEDIDTFDSHTTQSEMSTASEFETEENLKITNVQSLQEPMIECVQMDLKDKPQEIETSDPNDLKNPEEIKNCFTTDRTSNLLFFQSLLSDLDKLSCQKQRAFKIHVLTKLDEFLREKENGFSS